MSAVVFLLVPGLYRIFVELAKCGDFVTGFDDGTVRGKCFSVAKMLIDTPIRHFIKGWINLSLGEGGCGVFVKESGNVAAGCLGYQSSFVKTTEDALFDCPTIPSTMGLSEGRKLEGRHVLVAEKSGSFGRDNITASETSSNILGRENHYDKGTSGCDLLKEPCELVKDVSPVANLRSPIR